MIVDLLVGIFGAFGAVVSHLGIGGTFFAVVGLVLVYFLVKFLDRADRFLERIQRRWKRWTPATRWSLALVAAVLVGPAVWAAFPKSAGAVAVGLGVYAFYAAQGWRFVERYDLHDTTMWGAWSHHLNVSRAARRHTAAIGNATGKKGGRARKPTPHPTGETFVVEPPFGESANDMAERYNTGQMTSAEAAQRGWGEVRGVNATAMPDGTVMVNVDNVDPDGGEPLEEAKWWTP
jgi:hypothetical protein